MDQLDAAALDVVGDDAISLCIRLDCCWETLHMLGFKALALVYMKDVKIAEEGNLLLFCRKFLNDESLFLYSSHFA